MSKNEMIAFRSAFQGYNKSDVNEYIQKMNREFDEYEKKSAAELESVRAELSDAAEKLARFDQLQAARDEALRLCDEKERQLKEQAETISVLNEKVRQQEGQLAALGAERDNLLSQIKVLSDEVRRLNSTFAKSARYDEISAQLGELIITAKKTANEIIDSAKTDAGKMKEAVNTQLLAAKAEATDRTTAALDAINQILHTMVEKALGEINIYVKNAQDEMSRLLINLEVKNRQISGQISSLSAHSSEEIKQQLAKIDFDSLLAASDEDAPGGEPDMHPYLDLTETKEV